MRRMQFSITPKIAFWWVSHFRIIPKMEMLQLCGFIVDSSDDVRKNRGHFTMCESCIFRRNFQIRKGKMAQNTGKNILLTKMAGYFHFRKLENGSSALFQANRTSKMVPI
jgi:hypothetical protein